MTAKLAAAMTMSAAILAATAHAANCPISECNYLDPQFKVALDAYNNCTGPVVDAYMRAIDALAVMYPRFGVAWNSQKAEISAADSDPNNPKLTEIVAEITRRFEDRILQTAESDALQAYNLWGLKLKRETERCGSPPEPPKKHP